MFIFIVRQMNLVSWRLELVSSMISRKVNS